MDSNGKYCYVTFSLAKSIDKVGLLKMCVDNHMNVSAIKDLQ